MYVRHVYVRRKQKKLAQLWESRGGFSHLFVFHHSSDRPAHICRRVTINNKVLWCWLETWHQTRIIWMIWENLASSGASLGEWEGFIFHQRELVCKWAGEGENQLCTANTSSCHGLQLHIWSGLWGWGHQMLKLSVPEADPALHSFLIFFQLLGGKSSVLNHFCSDHYS